MEPGQIFKNIPGLLPNALQCKDCKREANCMKRERWRERVIDLKNERETHRKREKERALHNKHDTKFIKNDT